MEYIGIEVDSFDKWFEKEVSVTFIDFAKNLAKIMDHIDVEISNLLKQNFEETLIERISRDLKADAYDQIDKLIDKII